ncbi:MAG: hypothetical protein JXR37_08515 [Kiritimatiellae bacterium]|nr:hypothetical protein [Kiritimatiellia bacterium]
MSKPYVFICFDTEDPINPEADDAVLRLARLYEKAGIQACYFMTGEKARMLRERGRKDVLDALKIHDIAYHGNYGFEYPEPALLYGNRDPWELALQKGRMYETPGLQDVAEICGQFPIATCQHQNNHSPATSVAMQQAGVRVWNGGLGAPLDGVGWVMGLLVFGRHSRVVSSQGSWARGFQYDPDRSRRRPARMDPKAELKAFQETFDAQLAKGHSHVTVLGHPACWVMAEWGGWYEWSIPFRAAGAGGRAGLYPHGRRWERGVTRTKADTDAHVEWTGKAARWLAARNDIRPATFTKAYAEYAESPGPWLTGAQMKALARRMTQRFDHARVGGITLSAADALVALAQYTGFMLAHGSRPDHVQIRRTLGPVEEVLIPKSELSFSRQACLLGARQVTNYVNAHGRLPAALRCHRVDCGPGELLLALARALAAESLPDEVTVQPTAGVPDCARIPFFDNCTASSTIAPPGYSPDQIRWQGRQQSWSYRPALGGRDGRPASDTRKGVCLERKTAKREKETG